MKIIVRYLGYLFFISAFFRVVPLVTALIYHESIVDFLVSAAVSVMVGISCLIYARKSEKKEMITINSGFILAAISFILIPLVSTISYLPYFQYNFIDAFFESVSGFTTTGLTLFQSLDELPKSLLMWRAETQWLGGLGIIMFFLFLISYFTQKNQIDNGNRIALYRAQGFEEKLEGGFKSTLINVMLIYFGYTMLGIMLLLITGMNLFESIGMTFTALSTGGFTLSDNFYINDLQLIFLSILMLIGAISFIIHNKLLNQKFVDFFRSYEKNVFIILILVSSLITLFFVPDLRVAFFEIISAFTTTGYSLSNIPSFPHMVIMLIILGMIIGGTSSSTAGGLKVGRFYILLRSIPWYLKKKTSPLKAIIPLKIHGHNVEEEKVTEIGVFSFAYLLIIVAGIILFMFFGYSFLDSSFQVVSALGTVGLSTMELHSLNALLKFVLILAMIFGRLEIFPLLIVLKKIFVKSKK